MVYIIDGIAYAKDPVSSPPPKITGVRALPDYHLWTRLDNGDERVLDFRPLLDEPCYHRLKDPNEFNQVYLDYGAPTWSNGEIDIAPEYVLQHSK